MAPKTDRHDDAIPPPGEERKPEGSAKAVRQPAAGPHAKPELTNPDATPGAGALSDEWERDGTDSTTG
jgi:hypothetical protein